MPGSQEAGRSNPLAGRVTIHRRPEYVGVRFQFGNQTERPIGVSFSQPIPDSTAPEQFRFQPERHGDSWTVSEATLSFAVEVDGRSTVETGYALTDTEVSTVWNAINQGAVTVSDADGEVLGQVGGLEPNVVDETDESERGDDNSPPGQSEATPAAGQETGRDAASASEDDPGSVGAVDATAVAELAQELDAEEPAPEADAGAGGDDETADLPATRADYILSDVRGEIQSATEFEWRTLRERSRPRQFVDKVRSWLGF